MCNAADFLIFVCLILFLCFLFFYVSEAHFLRVVNPLEEHQIEVLKTSCICL